MSANALTDGLANFTIVLYHMVNVLHNGAGIL